MEEMELKKYYNSTVAGAKIQSNAKKIDEINFWSGDWMERKQRPGPTTTLLFFSFCSLRMSWKKKRSLLRAAGHPPYWEWMKWMNNEGGGVNEWSCFWVGEFVVGYGRCSANAPQQKKRTQPNKSSEMNERQGRQPTNKWNKEEKPMKGINLMKLNWWMDWRPFLCGMSWLWLGAQPSPRSNFIPIQLIEFPFRTAWLHLASWTIQFHSIHHSTPSKDWLSFIYELVSLILFILLCE